MKPCRRRGSNKILFRVSLRGGFLWSGDQHTSNYLALISNNWQAGLPSQLRGPAARWLRLPALKEGRPCPQGGAAGRAGSPGTPRWFQKPGFSSWARSLCRIHKDFIQKMGDSGNHERPDLVTSFSVLFFFLLLGLILLKMFMHMPVFPNACLVCSVSTYTE